jgi:hypothetical protein
MTRIARRRVMLRMRYAMLVDARWPAPDPGPNRPQLPWGLVAWPLLTVVLLAVGMLAPPAIAYVCVIGALCCAVESFARLVPRSGAMKDYRQ